MFSPQKALDPCSLLLLSHHRKSMKMEAQSLPAESLSGIYGKKSDLWKMTSSITNILYCKTLLPQCHLIFLFDKAVLWVWCLFPLWTDEQYMWFCVTLCKSNQHSTNEMLEHCSLLSLWLLFSCVLKFCSVELQDGKCGADRGANFGISQKRGYGMTDTVCSPCSESLKILPCTVSFVSSLHYWYSYQGTFSGKKPHHLSSLPFFCSGTKCGFSLSSLFILPLISRS